MKKLITAAALAAFAIASTTAMAEDSSQKATTQKTPTQQQMDTQATGGAKVQTPAATTGASTNMKTGASTNMNMNAKSGESKIPGKPGETVKEGTNSK
jgi:hypothetical protein